MGFNEGELDDIDLRGVKITDELMEHPAFLKLESKFNWSIAAVSIMAVYSIARLYFKHGSKHIPLNVLSKYAIFNDMVECGVINIEGQKCTVILQEQQFSDLKENVVFLNRYLKNQNA